MNFGEFINAFGTGYKNLTVGLTKPFFCRYLLCNITKDETVVVFIDGIKDKAHERGESAFQAFYRNNDRRSLHPIAERLFNSNSIDENKFMLFLQEFCGHYDKEELLKNFKPYLPSSSHSTLFKDITNEFVKILREEAAIPDKRRKEPLSLNSANRTIEINASLGTKIDMLLKDLITTGREIAEFKRTGVGDDVRYSRLKTELSNYFEQLLALSKQLSQNTNGEESSVLCDIRSAIQSLTAENFILSTNQFMIVSAQNYHIHRLSRLLSQLQKENTPDA